MTRIGYNSKYIFLGDVEQCDLHNKKDAAAAGLGLIIHGIYFSPLIIVSIVCFIIGFNTIAIMTLIAFISILVITYKMLI